MSTEQERRAIAEAVKAACVAAAEDALERAGMAGLCAEGRLDLVMDALRALRTDEIAAQIHET